MHLLLKRHLLLLATAAPLLVVTWHILTPPVYGAQLGKRQLQISNSVSSATNVYRLGFDLSTPGPLGSVVVQFCSNSPFVDDPCTAPTGMNVAAATISAQSGQTGFSIATGTNSNQLVLSRSVAVSTVGAVSYTFLNVVNPNSAGSYYAKVQTFATTDGTGPAGDYGGIAFNINSDLTISAEVPPYLTFCTAVSIPILSCASASGDYINFGELSSTRASLGTSQLLSATNAKTGYNVTLTGTTLLSGSNAINALAARDVSRPGTAQFGLNLRANASPGGGGDPSGPGLGGPVNNYNLPNFYQFVPGDIVIAASKPDDLRLYTASYVVNVPKSQAAGVYVSTVTYICLGNF